MDEIRIEWLMTTAYSRIFDGLGNKFAKWFFPKGLLMYQTSSPGFGGVYCNEKRFPSRTVTIL